MRAGLGWVAIITPATLKLASAPWWAAVFTPSAGGWLFELDVVTTNGSVAPSAHVWRGVAVGRSPLSSMMSSTWPSLSLARLYRSGSSSVECLRRSHRSGAMQIETVNSSLTVSGSLRSSGRTVLRNDHLIELMRASDLIFAHVLLLAGRDAVDHQRVSVLREEMTSLQQTVESLIEKMF